MRQPAFISYARADAEFALRVAADLKAKGSDVWLDQLDIHPGKKWDSEVEKALAACSELIVILSPASVASENVMDEVAFAIDEGKRVIPVMHIECKVPFRLRRLQYIAMTPSYESGLRAILAELGGEAPQACAPRVRADTPRPSRRAWIALLPCCIGPLCAYSNVVQIYAAQRTLAAASTALYGLLFAAILLNYRPAFSRGGQWRKLLPGLMMIASIAALFRYALLIGASVRDYTALASRLGVIPSQLTPPEILARTGFENIPHGAALLAWYLASFFAAESALAMVAVLSVSSRESLPLGDKAVV